MNCKSCGSAISPLRINASEIRDLDWCPQFHANRWKHRRQAIGAGSEARDLGIAAHDYFESVLRTHPAPPPPAPTYATMPAAWQALGLILANWAKLDRSGWQILAIEEPMELSLGVHKFGRSSSREVIIRGIPDAILKFQNRVWSLEHKTIGQSTPADTFAAGMACSLQQSIYGWLIQSRWPDLTYGGCVANIVKRLSHKAAKEDPMRGIHVEFLPILPSTLVRARRDVIRAAQDISGTAEPYRRRDSCTGRFGNSRCEFWRSCWDGIELSNPILFEDSEPDARYRLSVEGTAS